MKKGTNVVFTFAHLNGVNLNKDEYCYYYLTKLTKTTDLVYLLL